MIPVYLFNIGWEYAFCACAWRFVETCHRTFFVNSAAHSFGPKPYSDKTSSVENPFVSLAAMGEGYHNYHHAFPQDYAASEDGFNFLLNPTKHFIDLMAFIGLASNLKRPTQTLVEATKRQLISKNK